MDIAHFILFCGFYDLFQVGIDKFVVFALDETTARTLEDLNVSVLRLPSLEQICPECSQHQVIAPMVNVLNLIFQSPILFDFVKGLG